MEDTQCSSEVAIYNNADNLRDSVFLRPYFLSKLFRFQTNNTKVWLSTKFSTLRAVTTIFGYIPKQLTFFKEFFFIFFSFFLKQRKNEQIKKYYNIFDQYRP